VELLKENQPIPWQKILDIYQTMNQTSFCGLGKSIYKPVKTYIVNILQNDSNYQKELEGLNI